MPTYHEVMTTDLSKLTAAATKWEGMAGEFRRLESQYARDVHGTSLGRTWQGMSADAAASRSTVTLNEYEAAQKEAKAIASLLRDAHTQFVDLRSKVRSVRPGSPARTISSIPGRTPGVPRAATPPRTPRARRSKAISPAVRKPVRPCEPGSEQVSKAAGRTRPSWKAWAVVAVLVTVVAGLLHAYRNTNVLTADRLCGGLVSAESADAVLPGSGRVSAEGGSDAGNPLDTTCEVAKSSVVLGAGKGTLSVRVSEERGDFPFVDGRWPDPARASFLPAPLTGGVYEYDGWVLLPDKCWTNKPVILEAHSSEPVTDSTAFGALLTDAARAVAAEAECGDLPKEAETPLPPRSPQARPASEGRLCGLAGLSVHGQVPADSEVLEAGQAAPADLWSCTVFLP